MLTMSSSTSRMWLSWLLSGRSSEAAGGIRSHVHTMNESLSCHKYKLVNALCYWGHWPGHAETLGASKEAHADMRSLGLFQGHWRYKLRHSGLYFEIWRWRYKLGQSGRYLRYSTNSELHAHSIPITHQSLRLRYPPRRWRLVVPGRVRFGGGVIWSPF